MERNAFVHLIEVCDARFLQDKNMLMLTYRFEMVTMLCEKQLIDVALRLLRNSSNQYLPNMSTVGALSRKAEKVAQFDGIIFNTCPSNGYDIRMRGHSSVLDIQRQRLIYF